MASKFFNGIDLTGQKGINVLDPTSAQDIATKNYVDNLLKGLDWHTHVRAMVSSNINIASPGTTLNGLTAANGERYLFTAQTTASQNGIWIFNGSAAAMTRPTDYAAAAVLVNPSVTVLATEGTTNANTSWTLSTDGTVTVDTTSTAWVQVGGGNSYLAGNGLQLVGSTFSVLANGSSIVVGPSGISATPASIGATTKYAADSPALTANTDTTVTHNLGTTDVQVQFQDKTTGAYYEASALGAVQTGINTITMRSATAQSAAAFRVIVIG